MSSSDDLLVSIQSSAEAPRTLSLSGNRFLIGRERGAAIALSHPAVSRRHAEIVRDPFDRWWVRDLGSRHGTSVNGRSITEHVLVDRDELRIGGFRIQVRIETSAEPAPSATGVTLAQLTDPGPAESIVAVDPGESPALTADRLRELIALNGALSGEVDQAERWRRLCEAVSEQIPGDSTALVVRVSADGEAASPIQLCRVDNHRADSGQPIHLSRTLLELVGRTREPAVASNVGIFNVDARLSISPVDHPLAAMACPLEVRADSLDLLYLQTPPEFAAGEWLAMATIAASIFDQAETARRLNRQVRENEIIESDLVRARRIQNQLLPKLDPPEGWDIAVGSQPCRWVGGDYVDVLPCPDGRLLLVIADVCGKGLPAAMLTGNVHAIIHANVARGWSLAELAGNANTYLERTLLDDSFVTLLAIALDPTTGECESIAAGHPAPFHASAQGVISSLAVKPYPPLGICDQTYEVYRHRLAEGEWLLGFTDGASDSCNEDDERLEEAGLSRLAADTFRESHSASAAELVQHLNQAIEAFTGRALPVDDRTFLAVRRLP